MASTNDITNDRLVSKANSNAFRDGWDNIFNKDKKKNSESEDTKKDSKK